MEVKLEQYKKLVNQIQAYIELIEEGNMTIDQVDSFQKDCAALNERAIILKYKTFERFVKGENETPIQEVTESRVDTTSEVSAEIEEVQETEEYELNFNLDAVEIETTEPEPEPEPEIEAEIKTEVEVEVEAELEEEVEVIEQEILPEPEVVSEVQITEERKQISFENEAVVDNSMATQFEGSKIETLVGAFGLNQKLRYINDLFDGSSELFGDTIKVLDGLNTLNEAKEKVGEIAAEHEWDAEEESVVEFISILKRRYA